MKQNVFMMICAIVFATSILSVHARPVREVKKADQQKKLTRSFGRVREPLIVDQDSYQGIAAEKFNPPIIAFGSRVLDVGAGDGIITEKLIAMAGKGNVIALEPDGKKIEILKKQLVDDKNVCQKTLQEAVSSELERFDIVTIFKYNVPLFERDAFLLALSRVVKPEGKIFITSVERERFVETKGHEVLYLLPHLAKYFSIINCHSMSNSEGDMLYGLMELKPKIGLT